MRIVLVVQVSSPVRHGAICGLGNLARSLLSGADRVRAEDLHGAGPRVLPELTAV